MDRENSGPRLIDPGGIYFDEYGNLVEAQIVYNQVKELALEIT
jgi:exopolysaccharide biosynthesis predicted pyruvyltransferase EpsI